MFLVVSFILKSLDIGNDRREEMSERDGRHNSGFKSEPITGKVSKNSFLHFCFSQSKVKWFCVQGFVLASCNFLARTINNLMRKVKVYGIFDNTMATGGICRQKCFSEMGEGRCRYSCLNFTKLTSVR